MHICMMMSYRPIPYGIDFLIDSKETFDKCVEIHFAKIPYEINQIKIRIVKLLL